MRYARTGSWRSNVLRAVKGFPAIILTGPRRAGKTSLLRRLFPKASYFLLEDPDIVARLRTDPQGFLDAVSARDPRRGAERAGGVRIRPHPYRPGAAPRRPVAVYGLAGGAAHAGGVGVHAGRAAVFQLLPLSTRETPRVTLLHGGYPEPVARPTDARLWFSSYLQTYLERDVRAVTAVKDLATFRRFLAFLREPPRAGAEQERSGRGDRRQRADDHAMARRARYDGTDPDPAAFYENLGKRLIKSPKCTSPIPVLPAICWASTQPPSWPSRRSWARCSRASLPRRSSSVKSTPVRAGNLLLPGCARTGGGLSGAGTRRLSSTRGVQGDPHGHAGNGRADAAVGRGAEREARRRDPSGHGASPPGA